MKSITKFNLLLSMIMIICLATGCAFGGFDASGYVKACLDSNVHGEFEEYAKITNSSVEDVEKLYNDFLDNDLAFLDAYNVDDATKAKFRELFINLYKNLKYEVGTATKDGENYTVPVTVHKLMVFRDVSANMESDMEEYVNTAINSGKTPSTDEIYKYVLDYMYDGISNQLNELEYADPETINVTVKKDPSLNAYKIDETELQNLILEMVDMENAN